MYRPISPITRPLLWSIMNESDVRMVSRNEYYHQIRNKDSRIYLGCTSSDSASSSIANRVPKVYKLLQTVQEESHGSITLLKSVNPTEFSLTNGN